MEEELKSKIDNLTGTDPFIKDTLKHCIGHGGGSLGLRGVYETVTRPRGVIKLEDFVNQWNLRVYDAESVGIGYSLGNDWRLTQSETKWLVHVIDRGVYDVEGIEREEAPDFSFMGEIGIEVKSNENYRISRQQLHSINDYDCFHVFKSDKRGVEKLDTFDWLGMSEYKVDR